MTVVLGKDKATIQRAYDNIQVTYIWRSCLVTEVTIAALEHTGLIRLSIGGRPRPAILLEKMSRYGIVKVLVVGGFRIGIAAGRRTGTELTSERCSAEAEAEAEAGKRPVQYSALYFVKASLKWTVTISA